MVVNEGLAAQELVRRLVSLEYQDQPVLDIVEGYRAELRQQRQEQARHMDELSKQATYRVARVVQLITGDGQRRDRIAQVIRFKQSEIGAFCKANGINKDELLSALNSTRKEAIGQGGARWQHFPLLYAETSEQGNKAARESWELETSREEAYLAHRAKDNGMAYKPVDGPVMTDWRNTNG